MEQYWMPKKLDFKNLRLCIDNYEPDHLYIRLVGSMDGTVKVNESLEGRALDFKKDKKGLRIIVDRNDAFDFPLKIYDKGFSLAYERIETTHDGKEGIVILSAGIDPYDPALPEPSRSFLRSVLDDYLLEIYFKGRVHLKFHSMHRHPDFAFWTVTDHQPK